jgi:hypothetical protein
MSSDAYLYFAVVAALLVATLFLARNLWRGRLKVDGETVLRLDDPQKYWAELLTNGLTLLIFAVGLLIIPFPSEPDSDPPLGSVVLLGIVVPQIIRALWTGFIPFGEIWRDDRPVPFLVTIVLGAFVSAVSIWIIAARLSS